MAARVRITLLGAFRVEVDGHPIPESAWRLRKSRSVLKLLCLSDGRALHTERLQTLLWSDRDQTAAGNNLRQATYHARRALTGAGADGATVLGASGDLLVLAPEVDVDVDRFVAAADHADATGEPRDIETALAAYGGELLPEDIYEDWCADRRRVLAERYVALLLALAATRDGAAATDLLNRATAADPLNEEAHRALMRAYAASGRRAHALAQFEQLRTTLGDELAADPEPETRELYRELLAEGAPEPDIAVTPPVQPRPLDWSEPVRREQLPWQPTSFVGRRRELDELDHLLNARRLVTLTGPGGCGKTRLALELARQRSDRYRDGARAVELAGVADPTLVGQAVASTLGLDLRPGEAPESSIASGLAARELLLVLDNCEHLLSNCARLVGVLLTECPGVTIVATSREPLHLPGEVDWRVPSMTLLDTETLSDLAELAAADAVQLFCDRALSVNPRFRLTVANAQAVADICLRVDGLPLAIELAAARTVALSPTEIATRLAEGFAVLRGARAGGLTRQQTLDGTLDWSHDLLDEPERTLFRRLAVFAGGFELDAAEDVCADAELDRDDVLEVLASLVDKSLVSVDDVGATYRYRMLEPVRQYAAARLRASGEMAAMTGRHAEWFAQVTDAVGARVTDLDPSCVDRLERDHDNLRAAMSWLLQNKPERALQMAGGMSGLWLMRAHQREGCGWLDQALDAAPEPTPARADALHARQALERRRPHNYDLADALTQQRIAIYHDHGDRRGEALALLDLADGAFLRGRFDDMLTLAQTALTIGREIDDLALRAAAHERTGLASAGRQEFETAALAFDEAWSLCERAVPDSPPTSSVVSLSGFSPEDGPVGEYPLARLEETSLHFRRLPPEAARASLLSHRAYLYRSIRNNAAARLALDEALVIVRAHRIELDEARLLAQRGSLEVRADDLDAAEHWLEQSLVLRARLREHRGTLLTLATLGVVAGRKGEQERSAGLLGRATRMAEEAVDGPGMAGVLLAQAELDRSRGDLDAARTALARGLDVFYGVMGLWHYAAWVNLQHAHLSLALGDFDETARRLERAWEGFEQSGTRLGLEHCEVVAERLRAANGALTATGWTLQPHHEHQDSRRLHGNN
jgi:predicted ATPase/DNA-binding SARP family transcriptional activator